MVVLVTCKNDEDPSKKESTRLLIAFLIIRQWRFFSDVQEQLTL